MARDGGGLLFVALVGSLFLGLGLWLRFSDGTRAFYEIEGFNSSEIATAVTVLIITGLVMLITVVFGDNGACNEKRCALLTFSVLMTILAGALIVFGVMANARKEEFGWRIAKFYSTIYVAYVAKSNKDLAVTLTVIHKLLHCCGVTGMKSLDFAKETCPNPDTFWENIKMDACPGVIVDVVNRNAPVVMGVFIGAGVSLVIARDCSIVYSRVLTRGLQPSSAKTHHWISSLKRYKHLSLWLNSKLISTHSPPFYSVSETLQQVLFKPSNRKLLNPPTE